MVRELRAVFENRLLALEPLPLAEKQHVHVTITDLPAPEKISNRRIEQDWLAAHATDYPGQWVALSDDLPSAGWL